MGMPSWLYYLFALLMLAVAAYGVVLLALSVATRRRSGRDVDIAHAFMGVSMAGMFVTKWAFGPSVFWEIMFALLLIWFVERSIESVRRYGIHTPHEAVHAAMSLAMLLMYWFPGGSSLGAPSMSMSMTSAGSKLDPGLGFVLALAFFASAIFTLASPNKGASHHGTHALVYSMSGGSGSAGLKGSAVAMPSTNAVEALVSAPWLEDVSHVIMCVAMGFMLILMF